MTQSPDHPYAPGEVMQSQRYQHRWQFTYVDALGQVRHSASDYISAGEALEEMRRHCARSGNRTMQHAREYRQYRPRRSQAH